MSFAGMLTGGDMKEIVLKDPREIGPLIKELRLKIEVTQEELANYSGLSRIGIVKLEKEANDLKISTLINVANLLGFEVVLKRRSRR